MSGLGIVIPRSGPGTGPIVRADPLLSAGSLFLYEPTHPAGGLGSGVPANGAFCENVAAEESVALIGGGATASAVAATVTVGGAINNGTKGLIERTSKGSLHVIVSQATALAAGDGVQFNLPSAIRAYLAANTTHAYYYSTWDRVTRPNNSANTSYSSGVIADDNVNFLVGVRQDIAQGPNGPIASGSYVADPGFNTSGERFVAAQPAGTTTVKTTKTYAAGPIWGAPTGSFNAAVISTRNNTWPSLVFRRVYLEDLTVSGRTFADVEAADHALWVQQLGTGGRYSGDTFTAASTVA